MGQAHLVVEARLHDEVWSECANSSNSDSRFSCAECRANAWYLSEFMRPVSTVLLSAEVLSAWVKTELRTSKDHGECDASLETSQLQHLQRRLSC